MIYLRIGETVSIMILLVLSLVWVIVQLFKDFDHGMLMLILWLIANALTSIAFDCRMLTMYRKEKQPKPRPRWREEI